MSSASHSPHSASYVRSKTALPFAKGLPARRSAASAAPGCPVVFTAVACERVLHSLRVSWHYRAGMALQKSAAIIQANANIVGSAES